MRCFFLFYEIFTIKFILNGSFFIGKCGSGFSPHDKKDYRDFAVRFLLCAPFCAMIYTMKSNISVTIDVEILKDIEENFPNKKRSQVIEEALAFWSAEKRKNRIKEEGLKLKQFMSEALEMEDENIEDGLVGI